MKISVIVPTFNRGPRLVETVKRLLDNQVPGLTSVNVLVVDDGSPTPAETFLRNLVVRHPFTLEVHRQVNAGPARARNAGFDATSGDIVVFIDDDVLAPPDLLVGHVSAHRQRPGSVICGRCPWVPPPGPSAMFRVLDGLGYDASSGTDEEFVSVPIVASGQISVMRSMFHLDNAVYRDDLVTPGAEEYELSWRLRRRGVPILLAARLSALHDSSTMISDVCTQQYKHGVGCGEAARRCPETLELEELARIVRANNRATPGSVGQRARGLLKEVASSRPARRFALGAALLGEALIPQADSLAPLYRFAITVHFVAGVRDGLARFEDPS